MRDNRGMKIDGKALADEILSDLTNKVNGLKNLEITPTLAVILVGDDPNSVSYIERKKKAAERIGAKVVVSRQTSAFSLKELERLITAYNDDRNIHGIIVQRPVPGANDETKAILNTIDPKKDVDGFVPNSPFEAPVAMAVLKILEEVYNASSSQMRGSALPERRFPIESGMTFHEWLSSQTIVILGRGETAGAPILHSFERHCLSKLTVIHSQTPNPKEIMHTADIIVSCVGKKDVIKKEDIKPGAIVIGVGLHKNEQGKFQGDYDEKEIETVASFYTPTPGGVGPVNVACLMQNLITATQESF